MTKRAPWERERARMRAHGVLRLADPETVRWRALCVDCEAQSAEVRGRSEAVIWQIDHGLATNYEHEVYLVAVFRMRGGEGRFGIFS